MQSLEFATSIVRGFASDREDSFDEAYLEFVKRHFRQMSSWFANFHHIKPQDREDAVHDFFLMIRRKLRSQRSRDVLKEFKEDPVNGKRKFRNWLWQIAKHSSVDFVRFRKNKGESLGGSGIDAAMYGKLLTNQIELLFREDLETVLRQIGKRVIGMKIGNSGSVTSNDWDIFVRNYTLSREDLAREFETSVQAIAQSVYRTKKGLRKIRIDVADLFEWRGSIAIADDTISDC